ncbi:hypothetical protein [Pararhizobium sp. IMCC21322]|uniref:hypothetical protein n=1 Tax=Pararhizobium sp. IMCC21322 TaxID=3067903 RepID=UPI0027404EB0|nr:hypothetical protein [Pararhizobium sp. IMCC21322]
MIALPILDAIADGRATDGRAAYDFLVFWPAIYILSLAIVVSMLTIVIAHLIRLDASATKKFKILGVEIPIEFKGASLLMLLLSVAAGGATLKWDLVGLAELHADYDVTKLDYEREKILRGNSEAQVELLLTVLAGKRNSKGIEVLNLVVACGPSEHQKHSAWEVYNQDDKKNPWHKYASLRKPLVVSKNPKAYRMTQNGRELISINVEFSDSGVVEVDLNDTTSVAEFCKFINEPPSSGFGVENAEHRPLPEEISTDPDAQSVGEIESSAKRDG